MRMDRKPFFFDPDTREPGWHKIKAAMQEVWTSWSLIIYATLKYFAKAQDCLFNGDYNFVNVIIVIFDSDWKSPHKDTKKMSVYEKSKYYTLPNFYPPQYSIDWNALMDEEEEEKKRKQESLDKKQREEIIENKLPVQDVINSFQPNRVLCSAYDEAIRNQAVVNSFPPAINAMIRIAAEVGPGGLDLTDVAGAFDVAQRVMNIVVDVNNASGCNPWGHLLGLTNCKGDQMQNSDKSQGQDSVKVSAPQRVVTTNVNGQATEYGVNYTIHYSFRDSLHTSARSSAAALQS